jgi:hypothetical protein
VNGEWRITMTNGGQGFNLSFAICHLSFAIDNPVMRTVRIAALSLVVIAAVLQLSLGSRSTPFRIANAAILIVAVFVLSRLLLGGRARR